MNYRGVIIEESLKDNSIIDELKVVQREIEQVREAHETPWLEIWTCTTVDISEDVIDSVTERLSGLIDTEHDSSWYCDFRNEAFHYVVFSNRVFKLDRNNKADYDAMRAYAAGLGLPAHQMPNFEGLDIQLLEKFLVEAKKNTYASGDTAKVESSRRDSCDYHYEREVEGETMVYHDTYFGGLAFMGEEVVYRGEGAPKWGMNYRGVTFDAELSESAMDAVIRPALSMVGEDTEIIPVRGPRHFERDGYEYNFEVQGTIESFTGIETITKDRKVIFRLDCNGGLIK